MLCFLFITSLSFAQQNDKLNAKPKGHKRDNGPQATNTKDGQPDITEILNAI